MAVTQEETTPRFESGTVAIELRLTPHQDLEPFVPCEDHRRERRAEAVRDVLIRRLLAHPARFDWEGPYGTSDGFTGVALLLTRDGFVEQDWSCCGETSTWGRVEFGPDSVRLLRQGEAPTRYFVMPWEGKTYLVMAVDMRDFLEQANSGFLQFPSRGPRFLSKARQIRPDQTSAPDSYVDLWASLPHLEVHRVIAAQGTTPRLLEISLPGGAEFGTKPLTLYWDADPTGCVRAIERERDGQRLVAYIDACDELSAGAVHEGATFTPLPRLR